MVLALALAACASVLGLQGASAVASVRAPRARAQGHQLRRVPRGRRRARATTGAAAPSHRRPTCRRCHAKPHDERAVQRLPRRALRTRGRGARARAPALRAPQAHAAPHTATACAATSRSTEAHPEAHPAEDGDVLRLPRAPRPVGACATATAATSTWPREGSPPADHLVHDGDFVREHGVRAASARDLCASCHTERSCAGMPRRRHGAGAPRAARVRRRAPVGAPSRRFPRAPRARRRAPTQGSARRATARARASTATRAEHVAPASSDAQSAPAGLDHHGPGRRRARRAGADRSRLVRRLPRRRWRAALRRVPPRGGAGRQPARARVHEHEGQASRPALSPLPRRRTP